MASISDHSDTSDVAELLPKAVSSGDQPESSFPGRVSSQPQLVTASSATMVVGSAPLPAAGDGDGDGEGVAGDAADDDEEPPSRVAVRHVAADSRGRAKRTAAEQLAVAINALQWEDPTGASAVEGQIPGSGELQEECVGDFARAEVTGGTSKGKRGGRRSGDGDGRRRRSGDGEGRRRSGDSLRKSGDNEGRRRRSGDGRRSGDSRKSGENRRSGESRRNSGSAGSGAQEPEGEQLPQITDILLARLITSLSDSTLGNPALLLQSLLGFSPDDYNDLLAALSESRLSYVDIIAAYLHNIRVMSEDSGSASAALSGTLTRSLIEQYNNLLVQALKSPRPAMNPGLSPSTMGDMMMRSPLPPPQQPPPQQPPPQQPPPHQPPPHQPPPHQPPPHQPPPHQPRPHQPPPHQPPLHQPPPQPQQAQAQQQQPPPQPPPVHPVPKPAAVAPATNESDLPRGPSGLGFGRRSLDSLRQRQNFAIVPGPPGPPPAPKPVPRPGPRKPFSVDTSSNDGYQPPISPAFPTTLSALYPATAPQTYAVPPPPGFQPTPPGMLISQQPPPQSIPEQYAAYLNNARLPAVGIVPGLVPRLVHNPLMTAMPGLDFGSPGLVAGVAGIPVPSDWQNPPVLGSQQGIASWPQAQEGAQSAGPAWHGSLPVVQEHEQMDPTSNGYNTG